jgi:hypothetical protein
VDPVIGFVRLVVIFMGCLACSASAQQFDGELSLVPRHPAAGQPVAGSLVVPCIRNERNIDRELRDVTIVGDAVTIDLSSTLIAICGQGDLPMQFEIPGLEAGTYEVRVNLVSSFLSFPVTDDDRFEAASAVLVVGAVAHSVPVLSMLSLSILVGLFMVAGVALASKRGLQWRAQGDF